MKKFVPKSRITPRDSRSVNSYLHDITQYHLLTADEEVELARQVRNGDERALNRLITCNLRFVISVAKQYLCSGMEFADLISAGNIGLIKAAKRFDETRGIKFCSYAVWWIRQTILQTIAKEGRTIVLPANQLGALSKINRTATRLEQELQRTPSSAEVSSRLGADSAQMDRLMLVAEKMLSLDAPLPDEDTARIDTLADTSNEGTDKGLIQESLRYDIISTLSTLPQKERSIIMLSYGINQTHAYSVDEIALRLRLSRERVRQLHNNALKRLQRDATKEKLKEYL